MTSLRKGDEDLHADDGGHIEAGDDLALRRRLRRHMESHDRTDAKAREAGVPADVTREGVLADLRQLGDTRDRFKGALEAAQRAVETNREDIVAALRLGDAAGLTQADMADAVRVHKSTVWAFIHEGAARRHE